MFVDVSTTAYVRLLRNVTLRDIARRHSAENCGVSKLQILSVFKRVYVCAQNSEDKPEDGQADRINGFARNKTTAT